MGRVRRPRMSAREKVELWKRGESLSDIGRALGRIPGAVHHVVSARGGIPPPSRTRSRRSLTLTEREEISRGLARGYSVRQIGVRLSRAPSTISREVRRNGGRRQYRASVADARAWDRARRPKPCRLALSPLLRALVAEKLAADWSPQQISTPSRNVSTHVHARRWDMPRQLIHCDRCCIDRLNLPRMRARITSGSSRRIG